MRQRLCLQFYLSMMICFWSVWAQAATLESAKPWLGIGIEKGAQGVLINRVLAATPAEAAGLKQGDEVTAIDSVVVKEPAALIDAVQNQGVGTTVTVHFLRAGKTESKAIKLVARPDQQDLIRKQLLGHQGAPFNKLQLVYGDGPAGSAARTGKVTVLEFWATWCPACRSTHARLSAFAAGHKKDIAVVAVSDEETAVLTAYAKAVKPAFSILRDKDQATHAAYLVSAIPEIVVLDAQGQIAFVTLGAGEYLEEGLQKAEQLASARSAK